MSVADEIERLDALRQKGAISEEEYQRAKTALLDPPQPAGERLSRAVNAVADNENVWAMFLHFSQFCGYLVPLAGLIVPIVLWQVKKAESPLIDRHGRIVMNWIITEFIFLVVFALLAFVLVGIPLLIALGILGIIFPIIGGIKANHGEVWSYPLSIRFFSVS